MSRPIDEIMNGLTTESVIKNKIFVITDERCGGTQLGNLFSVLGYKVIDDPQTCKDSRNPNVCNKEFVLNNIPYFFKRFDYIKICMVSFSLPEYFKIVRQAAGIGCKFIFLWRSNYLERALSRAIAQETGIWNIYQHNEKYNGNFKLNSKNIREYLEENKKKVSDMHNFLRNNRIKYYPLLYENLYNAKLDGEERSDCFYRIIDYIQPEMLDLIVKNQHLKIVKNLSPNYKVNTYLTYRRITNIKDIVLEFSNAENGVIKWRDLK